VEIKTQKIFHSGFDNRSHFGYGEAMFTRRLLLLSAAALGLTACSSAATDSPDTPDATKVAFSVAASFYPIEEIARRVVGDSGEVFSLTPSGNEAHGLELTAKQLDQLSSANFLFYIGEEFQPSVEKAAASLKGTTSIDLLGSLTMLDAKEEKEEDSDKDGHDDHAHGEHDPHVWLDPANMAKMTRTVEATLAKAMPDMAEQFKGNADSYVKELDQLGDDIDTGLKDCESRALVTSHDAFGYLAARANLTTVPIAGVNPEDEPSAKELEAIAAITKEQKASTIFFEVLLPEDLADTLAKSVGATTSLLDPIEGISTADLEAGSSYISIQRDNLARLAQGLRCS
jgi:zinc transport system substrate-binding protein